MAGYLDHYGAGEERREQIIKRTVIVVLLAIIVGGVLYFVFKDYRQERQVRRFVADLASGDYKAAYALWGCTEAKPCRDYKFEEFMKDWGPQSEHADPKSLRVAKSRSCGSGVIITMKGNQQQEDKLWVQRDDLTIGFSPLPGCPPGQ